MPIIIIITEKLLNLQTSRALENGESPQGAFQIILHASAVQTAARAQVGALWVIIELKCYLTLLLNVAEILMVFFCLLPLAPDKLTPVQIA